MPEDIKNLLISGNTPGTPIGSLIDQPYKELSNFKVRQKDVRIVQIGGELATGQLNPVSLDRMKHHLELLDAFGHSGATVDIPVTEGDEQGNVLSERTAVFKVTPAPETKPAVIAVVPAGIQLGADPTGQDASTYTDVRLEQTLSIVRPDIPGGEEGVDTEACQSMVTAVLANPEDFTDVSEKKLAGITMLGQEEICNSIGKALFAQELGVPFENYTQVHNTLTLGGTNMPSPNDSAFYSAMPYITNPEVYTNISNTIPVDFGKSLSFPAVSN